jgi:hypothetical protein
MHNHIYLNRRHCNIMKNIINEKNNMKYRLKYLLLLRLLNKINIYIII